MPSPQVFISHLARDKAYARALANALRREGAEVWVEAPSTGARWSEEIGSAINQATVFVALVSPDFLSSQWGIFELGAALGRGWGPTPSVVLPVLIRGARLRDLPGPVRQLHALDARGLTPRDVSKRVVRLIRDATAP